MSEWYEGYERSEESLNHAPAGFGLFGPFVPLVPFGPASIRVCNTCANPAQVTLPGVRACLQCPADPWSHAMSPRRTCRTCVLSVLLVPALTLGAAEKMAPTKSNPPPVAVSGSYLVDKTIPAYGVLNQVPHYTDSRANTLYLEIHQALADIESQVMAGSIATMPTDKKAKKGEAPAAPIGDARINELLAKLVELDARITYRTYLEQWHIDNSFSDLGRAAELLTLNGQVGADTAAKVKATKPKPAEAAPAPEAPKAAPAPEAPPVAEPPAAEPPAAEPPAAEPPAAEPPAAEPPAVEPPPVQ